MTDPVAEQIVRAAKELGIPGVQNASTGTRYLAGGRLSERDLHTLAHRLLANPTIQRYTLGRSAGLSPPCRSLRAGRRATGAPPGRCRSAGALPGTPRAPSTWPRCKQSRLITNAKDRDPTDIEFETIAQTWIEHCVHKTFKARSSRWRTHPPQVVDNLLKTYLKSATEQIAAPWVRSAFVDNAGIIDFDDEYEVSFKVETHNHPSAIEPFGGANTGVGGVIRDVLGVSAKPIANTDVLCFGPQD